MSISNGTLRDFWLPKSQATPIGFPHLSSPFSQVPREAKTEAASHQGYLSCFASAPGSVLDVDTVVLGSHEASVFCGTINLISGTLAEKTRFQSRVAHLPPPGAHNCLFPNTRSHAPVSSHRQLSIPVTHRLSTPQTQHPTRPSANSPIAPFFQTQQSS